MLTKRLIVCLDVRNRKVTKGVKFKGNIDIGDPVEMGAQYSADGVDELVFYDITASAENRPCDMEMIRQIAKRVFIPFAVGGGIRNLDDMHEALLAGAEKVSVNSLAVLHPEIIADGAKAFGRQCVVLGMDAKFVGVSDKFKSGYEVYIRDYKCVLTRNNVITIYKYGVISTLRRNNRLKCIPTVSKSVCHGNC